MKTSEPAFPVQDAFAMSTAQGMTLRDYFAAKALQSVIVDPTTDPAAQKIQEETGEEVCYFQVCATIAYGFADAMLKAREQ